MFSEINSLFELLLKLLQTMKKQPFKTIISSIIIFSIALVKPLVFFSTLFLDSYKILSILYSALVLFAFIHFVSKKKNNIYFEKDTMLILTLFLSLVIAGNLICINDYEAICKTIYHGNLNSFAEYIHYAEYGAKFYHYVLSNFITILLLSTELINILISIYLLIYIGYIMCIDSNSGKSTIKQGFTFYQREKIIIIIIFIFFTSPWLYEIFILFWNKIF